MKTYPIVNLQGDGYLNPSWPSHQRSVGAIKHIAIHHDAVQRPHSYDSVARYRGEAREHYNRLGPGLQYHYKIDNVGTIYHIRPVTTWLYAVGTNANTSTVHICLDGYFHAPYNQNPTREQYEALSQLIIRLTGELRVPYANVWGHRSFKSTACPGDILAPYVFQISSKATAENIPNVPYDWPELQPKPPVVEPPKPPVDTRPEYEKNFKPVSKTMWVEGGATVLDLANGKKLLGEVADNTQMDIGGETKVGSAEYWISKYWVDKKTYSKAIPKAQLKDTPDVVEPPTPPVAPPPEEQNDDWGQMNNTLLKQILALLQQLVDKISSIFK